MIRLTDLFAALARALPGRASNTIIESYDRVAPLYEAVRPGYPDALVEYIMEAAQLGTNAKLLEIGCGTGRATSLFARKGYRLHGVEPSEQMAAIARNKLTPFPRVSLHTASFEQWDSEEANFDLAYAAQSFHWLDERHRLALISRRLKDRGTLAVFGNAADISADSASPAISRVLRRWAPALARRDLAHDAYASERSRIYEELRGTRLFHMPQFRTFKWRQRYSSLTYRDLLNTYSEYQSLRPHRLIGLLTDIGSAIDAQGGYIDVEYQTGVIVVHKR